MPDDNAHSAKHASYSIALVNYKTLHMTRLCLGLLRDYAIYHQVPVWVVDNGSADESTHYLRTLDWINLVERIPHPREAGYIAHGKALDLILGYVETPYLFLLHTDTFVFDTDVFSMMISQSTATPRTVAVGCTEQINRGFLRTAWRFGTRLMKYHYRTLMRYVGLPSKNPKPFRETHLKSFCTLWNCDVIKQHNLRFMMDNRVPGYALQDKMIKLGYAISFLSARRLFSYLDHIQAGTVAANGGYDTDHRRRKTYHDTLLRFQKEASNDAKTTSTEK